MAVNPGEKYTRWTVLEKLNCDRCIAACDCGTEREVSISHLRDGRSRSCGCLQREVASARMTTHGLGNKHPLYATWQSMRTRCENPNHEKFHRYGGRGIRVCDRWLDFANFVADMGERPAGFSLERINVNGHYEPSNCCWADATAQAFNQAHRPVERRLQGRRLMPHTLKELT